VREEAAGQALNYYNAEDDQWFDEHPGGNGLVMRDSGLPVFYSPHVVPDVYEMVGKMTGDAAAKAVDEWIDRWIPAIEGYGRPTMHDPFGIEKP